MSTLNKSLIRILIVDDHPIVCEGLTSLLSLQPDFRVCGVSDDIPTALELVLKTKPHVVTVDLSLKKGSGLELIRRISQTNPTIRLVVCSLYDEILYAQRALKAGAMGYVNKQEATGTIVKAIRQVLDNRVYLSERISELLAHRLLGSGRKTTEPGVASFSERELEVFQLIGQGHTTTEIATELSLGVKTVETHRRRVKEKLGLTNTAQLAHHAVHWIRENS